MINKFHIWDQGDRGISQCCTLLVFARRKLHGRTNEHLADVPTIGWGSSSGYNTWKCLGMFTTTAVQFVQIACSCESCFFLPLWCACEPLMCMLIGFLCSCVSGDWAEIVCKKKNLFLGASFGSFRFQLLFSLSRKLILLLTTISDFWLFTECHFFFVLSGYNQSFLCVWFIKILFKFSQGLVDCS